MESIRRLRWCGGLSPSPARNVAAGGALTRDATWCRSVRARRDRPHVARRHGVAEADLATEPVDCPLCSLAQVRGASAVLGLLVHDYTFNSNALWSHSG